MRRKFVVEKTRGELVEKRFGLVMRRDNSKALRDVMGMIVKGKVSLNATVWTELARKSWVCLNHMRTDQGGRNQLLNEWKLCGENPNSVYGEVLSMNVVKDCPIR